MLRLDAAQFEALVEQAVDVLPAWIGEHMQNVYITTAAWPTRHQMEASRVGRNALLLGLYEGVPLSRRGRGYHLSPPDRITLFQRPLEMVARDQAHLLELVRHTIVHEIAHHFGFSEDELARLEGRDQD
jgi:predicted Zn-dependent protease with MMP-like domain